MPAFAVEMRNNGGSYAGGCFYKFCIAYSFSLRQKNILKLVHLPKCFSREIPDSGQRKKGRDSVANAAALSGIYLTTIEKC